jgi:hypothetical protein
MKNIIIFFALFVFFTTNAQEQKMSWDYPIVPRTEEWKKLESNKAKVDVCQIPENILPEISTKDLMILCLQYPLLYDIFAFNNISDGVKKLFSDFNGIREFFTKEDALSELNEKYLTEIQDFSNILLKKTSNLEIGYSIIRISTLEILLSCSEFNNNTSKNIQKEILKNLLFVYKEKCKYPEYFQGNGFSTNLFARAHIIIKIDSALSEEFSGKNKSVLLSGMANAEIINKIDSLSNDLIK